MGRVKDYIIWHHGKYGDEPKDMSLVDEFLEDERKDREEWQRKQLDTPKIAELAIASFSLRIVEAIRDKKITLDELHWKAFEDLVAELLAKDGYTVQIGKRTKDGGVDIFAEREIFHVGKILTVWQAKKLKPTNKVGISTIRELADTRQEKKATKGIIVTNTFLTKGAIDRIVRDNYTLGKVEGKDLLDWIIKKGD